MWRWLIRLPIMDFLPLCVFISFPKGTISVWLISVGKCFKTQLLYNLWLSFHLPECVWYKWNSALKKQCSLKKKKSISFKNQNCVNLLLPLSVCCLKNGPWLGFPKCMKRSRFLNTCNLQRTGATERNLGATELPLSRTPRNAEVVDQIYSGDLLGRFLWRTWVLF